MNISQESLYVPSTRGASNNLANRANDKVHKDSQGLSWTVMDCHGLSWTVKDCHGLSWTVMDCEGQGNQRPWTDMHVCTRIGGCIIP